MINTIIITVVIIIIIVMLTPFKWLLVDMLFRIGKYAKTSSRKRERKRLNKQTKTIKIEWLDTLDEDFSFSNKWIYSEHIMHMLARQDYLLSDEELCAKWEKKENEERDDCIFHEKTHFPYTLQVEDQLGHIAAECIKKNKVECQSGAIIIPDLGFCFLNLLITDKVCYPVIAIDDIQINKPQFLGKSNATPSPFEPELINFCVEGKIKIDKSWWNKAQLKASFTFVFVNHNSNNKYTLTGKIYTPVKRMDIKSPVITDEKQYQYMISLYSKYK